MIHFRLVKDSIEDYELIAKWSNSDELIHLLNCNFKKGPHEHQKALDLYISSKRQKDKYSYIIYDDNMPIGEVSIQIDPMQLAKKDVRSAWLGIMIAEESRRGRGAGKKALEFIENIARDKKCVRMELGVFSYNENAIRFYKANDYEHFQTLPDFTYYDGKWHDDLRMEKYL